AMQDGVVTAEERARLRRAADSLGRDGGRLRQLEVALQAAYEARHGITLRLDLGSHAPGAPGDAPPPGFSDNDEPRASLQPLQPATDPRTLALQRRVAWLEARVTELEHELEEARAHVAVEVDFSDLAAAAPAATGAVDRSATGAPVDDPVELARRLRHDPRDEASLRGLFRAHAHYGDTDRQWLAAHALVYLGAASNDEAEMYRKHRPEGLIQPKGSVSPEGWRRLLLHPDEEVLTGEIFAVIVSAVLLGRVAALRHARLLPALDPSRLQDPRTSTVQAVRCFSWAASLLGMSPPPLYADPALAAPVEMVPGVPPASRLGKAALSGRSAPELAFLAGRHLAWYREERFVRSLIPGIQDLEDLFLAALTIGNPGLPLNPDIKRRVEPIAKAVEPVLEPMQIDRLRGHFLRFVEEGGRTNLQRWASAADKTALRAGLLLGNDLHAAQKMIELEQTGNAHAAEHLREAMDDLLVFTVSDRYAKLRKQIGVAL
ncbi:MAG: hypothetical protein WKG00_34800, partial [Polyangiaceae bacterium]